ncbi:hypothetical protein DFS34DRAFT_644895 [Phlyctochytrium arcticum]|nr:hypothetical protein DFS34DRAFT_644895 [Phlyctochytrium arcticum]
MTANFRKAYYSSLGVQVVEVTPTLENALQGDLLERLNKLFLWVRIPHAYRSLTWKITLGVLPLIKDVWSFVDEQLAMQYADLYECVKLLNAAEKDVSDDHARAMVCMFVIHHGDDNPRMTDRKFRNAPKLRHLESIANAIYEICDGNPVDSMWIFAAFVTRFQMSLDVKGSKEEEERIRNDIDALQDLLKIHCNSLLQHITSLGGSLSELCHEWFRTFFSAVVPPDCLEGVWDILLGGGVAINAYVGLSLLLASRRKIEATRKLSDLKIDRYVDMDAVTNTSIDMWERPILEGMSKDTRKALGYNF